MALDDWKLATVKNEDLGTALVRGWMEGCEEEASKGSEYVAKLEADNERLRTVIFVMAPGAGEPCWWCSKLGHVEQHDANCAAFHPTGGVR